MLGQSQTAYDRWLTTDVWAEHAEAEAEQIMNHGMKYFSDQQWGRYPVKDKPVVHVLWACEFCGVIGPCGEDCFTKEEW